MANVGAVTGSVPDVVSMAFGLSEAMAPEKGFGYNLCTFQIDLREQGQDPASAGQSASAAIPSRGSRTPSSATPVSTAAPPRQASSSGVSLQARPGPVIFAVSAGTPGERGGVQTVLELGIQELASHDRIAGVVELRKLEAFHTAIWDNLAIEVAAQEQEIIPQGVLLTVKGLINPANLPGMGVGFAHFIGAVLIRATQRGAGRPSLVCEPQFITQAPPRGMGMGLFGQVIETYSSVDRLRVWMYRAPLGSE